LTASWNTKRKEINDKIVSISMKYAGEATEKI
jgi:hypothetical protein